MSADAWDISWYKGLHLRLENILISMLLILALKYPQPSCWGVSLQIYNTVERMLVWHIQYCSPWEHEGLKKLIINPWREAVQ